MCNATVRTQRGVTTTREIERASEHDPELKSVRECLLNGKWHALEFKECLPLRGKLSAIGKLVLRGTRIVIPKQLRCQVHKSSASKLSFEIATVREKKGKGVCRLPKECTLKRDSKR